MMGDLETEQFETGQETAEERQTAYEHWLKHGNPPKKETSKVVLWATLWVCFILTAIIIVGWFMGLPDAPTMLMTVAGVATSVILFYIWKAKTENSIKLAWPLGFKAVREAVTSLIKERVDGKQDYGGWY